MRLSVIEIFTRLCVKNVVFMPDSLNSRLFNALNTDNEIKMIQCLNETDAITICSGLNLGGQLSVVAFENSGIRSVADILTRFEVAHHIHNIYLLTDRGLLGEENWWGMAHQRVTNTILKELNIISVKVTEIDELEQVIDSAIKSFKTGQVSVAINLTPNFFKSIPL